MRLFAIGIEAGQQLAEKLMMYAKPSQTCWCWRCRVVRPGRLCRGRGLQQRSMGFLVRNWESPDTRNWPWAPSATGWVRVLNEDVVTSCRFPSPSSTP